MKTDLIYGVEDRPHFKDALFAAFATSAGYLCSHHYTSSYHCERTEAGC